MVHYYCTVKAEVKGFCWLKQLQVSLQESTEYGIASFIVFHLPYAVGDPFTVGVDACWFWLFAISICSFVPSSGKLFVRLLWAYSVPSWTPAVQIVLSMSSGFAVTAAMVSMGEALATAVRSLKRKRSSLDLGAVMEEPASTDEADIHVSEPSIHEKKKSLRNARVIVCYPLVRRQRKIPHGN